MQTLEYLEDLVCVFHIESHAVVTNPQAPSGLIMLVANLYLRRWNCSGEFDGVVQVVSKGLRERAGIDKRKSIVAFCSECNSTIIQSLLLFLNQITDK